MRAKTILRGMLQFTAVRASISLFLLLGVASVFSQQVATANSTVVPALVSFSGTLTDINGKPLTSIVGVTFFLYTDQQALSPVWMETQNVTPDKFGHYSVQLGSTSSTGLPADIFVAGEARWLGVQPQGQAEYPRVMLLSVPYALKAGDAQTIGGLPPSAFVLATTPQNVVSSAAAPAGTSSLSAPPPSSPITGTGTVNFLPLWDTTSDIVSSVVFQSGTGSTAKIGINTTTPVSTLDIRGGSTVRGTLSLPAIGAATAAAGKNSQPFVAAASAFNSSTTKAVTQTFLWQAEPAGNNTSTPSGTLNLLFGSGTSLPAETGLKVASNGQITFATGQTFPGTGIGTVTSVATGAGLTGGPITSTGTLSIATGGVSNSMLANSALTINPGTGLIGGGPVSLGGTATLNVDTSKVPQLLANNTFTGNQTINGNLSATGFVTGSAFNIGSNLFAFGSYNNSNAFLGFAGNANMTGGGNTATGYLAFSSNATGTENTANGYGALIANTTGSNNTAFGSNAGVAADASWITGSNNTFIGGRTWLSTGTLSNATAIGANAIVTASNAMVLGSINGMNGATASTSVGIGTTAPLSPLEVDSQSPNIPAAISGFGFNAPQQSGLFGTPGIAAQGGASDVDTNSAGGTGVVASGGYGYTGGSGITGYGAGGLIYDGVGGSFAGGNSAVFAGYGDGIDATAGSGYAGLFSGDVIVTGNLSKGGGSFKIDHPLDPANKYLSHSFVESPDMMNIYNGNVELDANGEATIEMPDWFGVLNRDFRYQLTCIGGFAPVYVAEELTNNQFKIGGGKPGMRVSWQITGIRQDAWANAHRIPVEEEKEDRLKGFYIHPELYGQPEEKQIEWARHPENMRQMKHNRQKMEYERTHPSTLSPIPPSSPLPPARRPPLPQVQNLGKEKRSP